MNYTFTVDNKSLDVNAQEIPAFIKPETIKNVELVDDNTIKITSNLGTTFYAIGYDGFTKDLIIKDLIGKEIRTYLPGDDLQTEINEGVVKAISSRGEYE